MKFFKKKHAFAPFFVSLFLMSRAMGAETGFEYPELSVVPRATDRILMEAQKDREQRWKTHLPILVPALGNFVAGTSLLLNGTRSDTHPSDTSSKVAPWIGMGMGLAWTALVLGVIQHQDFYQEGIQESSKVQGKSPREQLLRERLAEESIRRAGSLARKLKWMSSISNLGASAFMIAASKERSASGYLAIGAAASALVPFLFPIRWEKTEAIHEDYKKRIYSPVAGATLLPDPIARSWVPGVSLAFHF
jgi:hypothetical protein